MQDGILASAGEIVSRMGELKGLYSDVMKKPLRTTPTYDAEFQDLQAQLFQLAGTQVQWQRTIFSDRSWYTPADELAASLAVYTSENGSSGMLS